MRRCRRYGCAAEAQGHGRRSQIEQRQHHLQHRLEAPAVFRQLTVGRDLAVLERHRRGGVGAQPEPIPRACDGQASDAGRKEIERRIRGAGPFGSERGHDIALGMAGAGHPRFLGGDMYPRRIPACARDRCPEMAAGSPLAERKSRKMPAGSDLLQDRRDGGSRASRNDRRGGARVHEIDHRDRRIRLGERRHHRRETSRSKRRPADLRGKHQSEEPGSSEGGHRLGGKSTLSVVLPGGWC